MSLKQQIQSDATQALKQGDSASAGVLRLVLSSMGSKEKEKRYKLSKEKAGLSDEQLNAESALSDEELLSVISSEIKKRKDAIELYQKGGRAELAVQEQKEIDLIKKYLPAQLPEEALRKLIQASIEKVGASDMKDMGKIMADLMPQVKGKADNSDISKIIKQILTHG